MDMVDHSVGHSMTSLAGYSVYSSSSDVAVVFVVVDCSVGYGTAGGRAVVVVAFVALEVIAMAVCSTDGRFVVLLVALMFVVNWTHSFCCHSSQRHHIWTELFLECHKSIYP